ncbi:MAG: hypothetical protein K6B72_05910 [Lachnospiraceae bacterium]|nr:hypothetical protein [Lachnospiraceae bacterium]
MNNKSEEMNGLTQARAAAVLLLLSVLMTGCGSAGSSAHSQEQGSAVDQVLEQRAAEADWGPADDAGAAASQVPDDGADEVDPEVLALVRDIADEAGVEDPILADDPEAYGEVGDWQQVDLTDTGDGFPMAEMPEDCDVDVDLTILNSTMVYSEVYNMLMYPDKYIGKSIRMHGNYNVYQDETTKKIYLTCFISDAAACCRQGIEFEPRDMGTMNYPEDFPEVDDEITVVGTYDIYEEDGVKYCTLRDAVIEENGGLSL